MNSVAVDDRQLVRLTEAIEQRVGHQRYQVWFHNSTKFQINHDALEIAVPNDFISEWIGTHFQRMIQDAAHEVMGCSVCLRFNVLPQLFDVTPRCGMNGIVTTAPDATDFRPPAARERYAPTSPDLRDAIGFDSPVVKSAKQAVAGITSGRPTRSSNNGTTADPAQVPVATALQASIADVAPTSRGRLRHDFSTLIVGPSNQLAYNAATYVAEFPGAQYNPLFIHGACGLGKSHMLQSLCKLFCKHHPAKRWMYLTGEEFTNEFLLALRHNRVDVFRRKMRELDLLVIDDVHFFSGKKATQEEFLHTFNAIEAMGRQVVLASDEHPKLIGEFGESLINRFVSGMVVRVDAPNLAMRCEILRSISLRSRINLSEEVIAWIARRVTQNVRELEGAITRVIAHTRITGRLVDVALAQEALGDLDRQLAAPVKTENVLKSVCSFFGLEMRELMSGRRQRTISLARSIAMYLVRRTGKLSFPEIAVTMGKRNHSTVISACRRIERAAARNEKLSWTGHMGEREEEAAEVLQRLEELARSMA